MKNYSEKFLEELQTSIKELNKVDDIDKAAYGSFMCLGQITKAICAIADELDRLNTNLEK